MSQVTYLTLSPEFGGTRFGPFHGVEIRLGSDPELNDISLPVDLGVAPQHVKILQQGNETFIVAPVDRTAAVFVWRQHTNKAKQIHTPMAVKPGDAFSLVVAEGARFVIEVEDPVEQRRGAGGKSVTEQAMTKMPTSRGLVDEVKRRGFATVFSSKLGNMAMNGWRMIVTGQIFSPFYIIAGVMMLSGSFVTLGSCASAFSFKRSQGFAEEELKECKDQRAGLKAGDTEGQSVPVLTRNILGDNEWKPTLRDDPTLAAAYPSALDQAFDDSGRYKWAYGNEQSEFGNFARSIGSMPQGLKNTLAFLAVYPSTTGYREWNIVVDSEGEEVCARGPLRLTYRQGKRLGLENLQLDALVTESIAFSRSPDEKTSALMETTRFEGHEEIVMTGRVIEDAGGATVQGGRECMHVKGEDDRNDVQALSKRIKEVLGSSADGLADEGGSYWIGHRLAKLAAMDFAYQYGDLTFKSKNKGPVQNLKTQDVTDPRVQYAAKFIAQTMANAVVTRCSVLLDKDTADAPPSHVGPPADFNQCIVLAGLAQYDRLE